jgi:hypothetical protein
MARAARHASLAALALLALLAPAPAAARAADRLPSCAIGRTNGDDARALDRHVAAERRRLLARLESGKGRARAVFEAGVAAYLFGYPDVLLRRTVAAYPRNRMISIGALTDPGTTTVVAPNHDTLYSVGRIDLADGPLVIETPPTGGRYSVVQLLDTFTNAFAYLGDGRGARTGERAALVPPGWKGALPAGVRKLRSPSNVVWLLGRTLADDERDVAPARELMARYAVTPLADYAAGRRTPSLVLPGFPAQGRRPARHRPACGRAARRRWTGSAACAPRRAARPSSPAARGRLARPCARRARLRDTRTRW